MTVKINLYTPLLLYKYPIHKLYSVKTFSSSMMPHRRRKNAKMLSNKRKKNYESVMNSPN